MRTYLQSEGLFYLGEMVNVFRRGGLAAPLADSQLPFNHPLLYGTSEGSIGLIVRLPDEYGLFFSQVIRHKQLSSCKIISLWSGGKADFEPPEELHASRPRDVSTVLYQQTSRSGSFFNFTLSIYLSIKSFIYSKKEEFLKLFYE